MKLSTIVILFLFTSQAHGIVPLVIAKAAVSSFIIDEVSSFLKENVNPQKVYNDVKDFVATLFTNDEPEQFADGEEDDVEYDAVGYNKEEGQYEDDEEIKENEEYEDKEEFEIENEDEEEYEKENEEEEGSEEQGSEESQEEKQMYGRWRRHQDKSYFKF
uniref:Uncharacterized protein n=1 Tax=Caenorhabditis tropicalis TaxID=1561998 RepID=A0A1I7UTM7_9PELO